MEEAHLSPLDENLPEDMKVVNIKTIPEEIFMLIRVVALIRGMLISLDTDVHARMIWRPYAIAALRAAGERVPHWALEHEAALERAAKGEVVGAAGGSGAAGKVAAGSATDSAAASSTLYESDGFRMTLPAGWTAVGLCRLNQVDPDP